MPNLTFKMDEPVLNPLDLDGLVSGLVALQLDAARPLVAHEALVTLKHEDTSVNQIEVVSCVLLTTVAVNKQVSGLVVANVFSSIERIITFA